MNDGPAPELLEGSPLRSKMLGTIKMKKLKFVPKQSKAK